jgi:RNA polymerase sigma-70 factor (ECF subfamily)
MGEERRMTVPDVGGVVGRLLSPEILPDEDVVRRVLAGETALFEVLMRRYNQRLYCVARTILRDDSEAEDVMQQAYVNAFVHLGQFAERARFGTWLTRIAVNEALARAHRRGRSVDGREAPDEEVPPLATRLPDPEEQLFAGELRRLVEAAIDALPNTYRSVFVLRVVEGMNTAETALALEIGAEAVKTRLHRARAMLRLRLGRDLDVATAGAFRFHLSRCDRVVDSWFRELNLPAGRRPGLAVPSAEN